MPEGVLAGFHAEPRDAASGLVHGGESWAGPAYAIRPHTHRAWEIYVQAHGSTRWSVAGDEVSLDEGALLAVAPRVPHALVGRPGRHHFFYAAVSLDVVAARVPETVAAWPRGAAYAVLPRAGSLHAPLRLLMRELASRLPLSREGLRAAVDAVVVETARVFGTSGRGAPALALHPAAQRARDLLDERFAEPWTVAALARECTVSPSHLFEVFTRAVGLPPMRYLQERRIARAAELLATTDLPVVDVATATGFGSATHFGRVFKAAVRRTPRDYRAAHRG